MIKLSYSRSSLQSGPTEIRESEPLIETNVRITPPFVGLGLGSNTHHAPKNVIIAAPGGSLGFHLGVFFELFR